jgi:hypothetical protein
VFGAIAFSGFYHEFIVICSPSVSLTIVSSSRERNAVWLLEKARKANTRMLASVVPEEYCDGISAEALWNGRFLLSLRSP